MTAQRTVSMRLQGTSVDVADDLWRLWLMPGEPESGVAIRKEIDPDQPIAWREVDKLKGLTELGYEGRDAAVAAYVAQRKGLCTFRWTAHGQTHIDLSKSSLTELGLDVRGPLTLQIPPTLRTLRLTAARLARLSVETDDEGARLHLYVWSPVGPVPFLVGLRMLGVLTVALASTVDLRMLAKYAALRALTIHGPDTGVEVKSLATLAAWPILSELVLRNMYHTSFGELPALPSLVRLEIDGIRQEDAARVKSRAARTRDLSIRGVRSAAWLRKNADNPFRDWEEEHGAALGRRAKKAYRDAEAAIDKGTLSPEKAEAILRAFVTAFNAVESDIDTIMLEQIDEAYRAIAARLPIPARRATAWFGGWREF